MKFIISGLYWFMISTVALGAVLSTDSSHDIPSQTSSNSSAESSKSSSLVMNTVSSETAKEQNETAGQSADSATTQLENSSFEDSDIAREPQFYKPPSVDSDSSVDGGDASASSGKSSFGNFSGFAGAKSVGQDMSIGKGFALGSLKSDDENQAAAT